MTKDKPITECSAQIEAKRIQDEQQANLDAERKERERIEKELADKKAEQERIEEDKQKAIELELSKGDADKFTDLIADLENFKSKYVFTSKKYKSVQYEINTLVDKIIVHAQSKVK